MDQVNQIRADFYTTDQGGIVPQLVGNEFGNDDGRYENIVLIGEGAYGVVYRATDRHTNDTVALKVMAFQHEDDGIPMATMREISLLRRLDHDRNDNVVRLLDVCIGRSNVRLELVLVFEYCQQDLGTFIKKARDEHRDIPCHLIKNIFKQMLIGGDFLHTHQVVHRDLKPQNILVHNGVVKIADFGLARIHERSQRLTPVVVTLWYRAPEVLLNNSYSSPIDVWSFGCIFGELFNARALIASRGGDTQQLKEIIHFIGMPPRAEWADTPLDYNYFVHDCVHTHLLNRYGANIDLDSQLACDAVDSEISRIQLHRAEYLGKKDLKDAIPRMNEHMHASDLFWKMMTFNPRIRITCRLALQHPYFGQDPAAVAQHNEGGRNGVGVSPTSDVDVQQYFQVGGAAQPNSTTPTSS